MNMLGSDAFLRLLTLNNIDTIFGNPGTTELPLVDALSSSTQIRYILALQEAVVLAMADGYAQASGDIAVVNLHAAPGLGNALGMLYNAQRTGTPLLVTAGQHDQCFTLTEPVLWGDLPRIARPFVKWSGEVTRAEDLPRAVHRACKIAMTPPRGPVFLSIPVDVLTSMADIDLGQPTRIAPGIRGDRAALEAAAAALAGSEKPVLIAGDAVSQSDALDEMVALAELIGAPVYLEGAQNTVTYPSTHPLYRGTLGRISPEINKVLSTHDVMFSVGGDLFTLSLPSSVEPVPAGLKVIHLDNDPWELGKNFPTDLAILGDAKASLPELCEIIEQRMSDSDRARAKARREALEAEQATARPRIVTEGATSPESGKLLPGPVMSTIAACLPADVMVVEESLSSRGKIRELLRSEDVAGFFGMRGGGIGWGMAAAVGVKLAHPERPMVALVGDGSALYSYQALWTAANQKLGGTVFIILNNSSYRILKQRTRAQRAPEDKGNPFLAMDLDQPAVDYVSLSKSFGIEARIVTEITEIPSAIEWGLAANAPVLIDIKLDRAV